MCDRVIESGATLFLLLLVSQLSFAAVPIDFLSMDTEGEDAVVLLEATHITSSAIDVGSRLLYLSDQGSDLSIPGGRILRMNLDGSGQQDLIVNQWPVFGIALDLADGHIYYAESGDNTIRRANLDGSNVVDVVALPQFTASLALDKTGGKLYWSGLHKIWRSNLDGSGVEVILDNGDFNSAIALDLSAGRLYFGGNGGLSRANLDGSSAVRIFDDASVFDFTLDLANATVYWCDLIAERMERSALDGSDRQLLRRARFPGAIALDPVEQRLYLAVSELDPVQVPATSSGALLVLIAGFLAVFVARSRP